MKQPWAFPQLWFASLWLALSKTNSGTVWRANLLQELLQKDSVCKTATGWAPSTCHDNSSCYLQKTCILWFPLIRLVPKRACSHYLMCLWKGFLVFFPFWYPAFGGFHFWKDCGNVWSSGSAFYTSTYTKKTRGGKEGIIGIISIQKLRWAHLFFQKICVLRSICVCLLGFSCYVILPDQLNFRVIAREDIFCWRSVIF